MISARVHAKHPQLALVPTLRDLPDADIRVFSEAATDPHHEVYFFSFEADDFDAVEAALAADDTVEEFTAIVDSGSQRIYGIEYSDDVKLLSLRVTSIGGLVLSSERQGNGWVLEMQLQDHEGLYELSEYAHEAGIQIDILEINRTEKYGAETEFGLTESQREALTAAFVNGYYDDPRELSLMGLADLLDISPTAASGRLRRGSARLIEEVFLDEESD